MDAYRNLRGLGNRLFVVSVIVGGIGGMKVGQKLAEWVSLDHLFLLELALMPVMAILGFWVLYRFVALRIVLAVEDKNGIELYKPSVIWGAIYSAIIPLIVVVISLFALLFGH
jgi:hypothetical protein